MVCFQAVAAIYQEQQPVPAHVMMELEITAHVVVPMVTVEEQVVNVMTALVAGIGLQVTGCVTVSSFQIYTISFFARKFDVQNGLLSGCGCNSSGTTDSSSTCDDNSGECSCQTGYSGTKCDECSSGYKLSGSTCIEGILSIVF